MWEKWTESCKLTFNIFSSSIKEHSLTNRVIYPHKETSKSNDTKTNDKMCLSSHTNRLPSLPPRFLMWRVRWHDGVEWNFNHLCDICYKNDVTKVFFFCVVCISCWFAYYLYTLYLWWKGMTIPSKWYIVCGSSYVMCD